MIEKKKVLFVDCHLAGRKYYDCDEVWDSLKIGTLLHLERENDNGFDPNAVAVVYTDEASQNYHIGYIPRTDNELLASFIDMGYEDIFETRISGKNELAHPEQQLLLTIRIKRREM